MTTQALTFVDVDALEVAPRRVSSSVARGSHTSTAARESARAAMGSRKVLVVDRDADFGARIVHALRGEDVEVTWCSPADDVLAAVFENRPDLVLVHTPHRDAAALAACARIRQSDSACTRTVIAYGAGSAVDDAVGRALAAGADDYLADVRPGRELRARVVAQLRHVSERERLRWARDRRTSLRQLAGTDPLTGIASRPAVVRALDRAIGDDESVRLFLLAVGGLRRLNATRGHPSGDLLLRRVARALSAATPPEGTAGRWGGTVFALVLPGQAATSLEDLGERLRSAVCEVVLPPPDEALRATASVGAASRSAGDAGRAGDRLIAAAEAALHFWKHTRCERVHPSATVGV
jgi:diguanylate cyclase (GGDEF)-like protein